MKTTKSLRLLALLVGIAACGALIVGIFMQDQAHTGFEELRNSRPYKGAPLDQTQVQQWQDKLTTSENLKLAGRYGFYLLATVIAIAGLTRQLSRKEGLLLLWAPQLVAILVILLPWLRSQDYWLNYYLYSLICAGLSLLPTLILLVRAPRTQKD